MSSRIVFFSSPDNDLLAFGWVYPGVLALQMRPIHGLIIPFCTNMMRRSVGRGRAIHGKRIGRRQRLYPVQSVQMSRRPSIHPLNHSISMQFFQSGARLDELRARARACVHNDSTRIPCQLACDCYRIQKGLHLTPIICYSAYRILWQCWEMANLTSICCTIRQDSGYQINVHLVILKTLAPSDCHIIQCAL